MLQLVVPGLFTSIHALSLAGAKEYLALLMLYARGRHQPLQAESVEELICRQFGITPQTDWPLAAITHAFDDGRPGSDYWLRADPVHIQVRRDKLILVDELTLTTDEAQAFCNALAGHFGEVLAPRPLQPDRWYIRVAEDPLIHTTPLSQALGKSIDPLMPQGPGAMNWRKLMNEAQMLLFSHPANQARESRGLPTVNSLWLWGGGTLPEAFAATGKIEFYGQDFTARAVAKFSGNAVHALPDGWAAEIKGNALCLFDQLNRCWQRNDLTGLKTALNNLETGWIKRLIKSRMTFRIDDPSEKMSLIWHPLDRWKFWRRSEITTPPELDFQPAVAETRPELDEFGNRY
jgi:hypothetical protein